MIRLSVQGTRWMASGALVSESCTAFCELLLGACDSSNEPAVLDLSGLESIDMHGVQVLGAFLRGSPHYRIEAPSEPVRAFLTRVGAFSLLVAER
ncbi:MAG: hypothetical protein QM756_07490 [Polyangiaceae bacterium]